MKTLIAVILAATVSACSTSAGLVKGLGDILKPVLTGLLLKSNPIED